MKNALRALRFFRSEAGPIAFAVCLLLLSSGASLLKPWPLALIVDVVLSGKPLPAWMSWASGWPRGSLLALFGLSIVGLYALHGALSAWQTYSSIRIGLRGLVRVRNEVFHWLEHLSLRFHQARSEGDLIYRLSWDTYAFQTLFQQGIFTLLSASFSLLLMLVVMWNLNAALAALALLAIPLLGVSMKFLGRGMNRRSLAAHQADSQVTAAIQETMAALPLIQSYTREEFEHKRFAERVEVAYEKRVAQHGWEVLYWLVMAVGFGLATAGLTWLGAAQVLSGRLTVGEMLVFLGYLSQLYEPLNQLSHVGATVSDATAGTQRVLELLDSPQELTDAPNARPVLAERPTAGNSPRPTQAPEPLLVRGNVALDHVSFAYETSRPVLKDVTFSVAAGESVAIIGPSGAGKTTLLQLLLRFYDPNSGAVRLEGADLRQLRLKQLRAQISLVPQEPILLSATVAENIAYGRPGASAAEIQSAATVANAHEFIRKLPQQYETLIGPGAARLSAGEKQRINLARAFLKNAPILVLDEPTSALDAASERLVVQGLAELMKQRTSFLVAHRLSTVRRVDRIIVLEAGQIVEAGTPEELLRRKGYYARLTGGELRWD